MNDEIIELRELINRLDDKVSTLGWEVRNPPQFLSGDRVYVTSHSDNRVGGFAGVVVDNGVVSNESFELSSFFVRRYQVFSDKDKRLHNISERAMRDEE